MFSTHSTVIFFFCTFVISCNYCQPPPFKVDDQVVQGWADKLGAELWNFGDYVTRRKQVLESFKDAKLVSRDGPKLVQDIAKEIQKMMDLKISAVRRIMDTAETLAEGSNYDVPVPESFKYYNAKMLIQPGEKVEKAPNGTRELLLTPNSHFYNIPVNTSLSSVHVPTNVYDRSRDVIHAIQWSEKLDQIFTNNYKGDPSLSWQYFGSSTGFMRQFPAMEWKQEPVDVYDCRMRSWYIEAATSPKDILILVDNSGSMMGQRKEIARHVVNNILDTLGNNDFVNIMTFVNDTEEVVPCFKDTLVQANLANIRELKNGLNKMSTKNIANFTIALSRAFDILQYFRDTNQGACCNQAIMLITDGVPYNFEEIFREYNWPADESAQALMPVRVFTYLLGREVADIRDIKWMACANKGYYVHLSTNAEVREQVLQYVPVMARPLVLQKTEHPIIWTPVYADVTDPKMTDWLWEMKECAEQRQLSISFRKDRNKFLAKDETDKRFVLNQRRIQDQSGDLQAYKLMTSVSMPVYDRRDYANITERVLMNEAYWVEQTREKVKVGRECGDNKEPNCVAPEKKRVAFLLGVAGTDVPNQDIQSLMMPDLLGVNGYAFMITNNGYILIHPDFRPVFQGILKPSYSSIDMTDVEIVDDGGRARKFSTKLIEFRQSVIEQKNGFVSFKMKQHYDNMKRVTVGVRNFYYTGIVGTPFTLVISLPEKYGNLRVDATEEIRRAKSNGKNILDYFQGKNWKVHPDWFYCKYHFDDPPREPLNTPEEEVLHFLHRANVPGWKWPLKRNNSPPEHQTNSSSAKSDKMDKDSYFCERSLVLSLLYDAKVTDWFDNDISSVSPEDKGKEVKDRFGLTLMFLATRSGLTRWQDYLNPSNSEDSSSESPEPHFSEIHNHAIDEVWYKRAVEQHYFDRDSFVYAVPFDNGTQYRNNMLVTASHAIFLNSTWNGRDDGAPAAVVGFQFLHTAFHSLFINITYNCPVATCKVTCANDDIDCFVLDSNAYVMVSENKNHTGKFFGEIIGFIMEKLVQENVYQRVHMFDYQAVCFRNEPEEPSRSGKLYNPAHHLGWFFNWIIGNIFWLVVQMNFQWLGTLAYSYTSEDVSDNNSDSYPENYSDGLTEPTMAGAPDANNKVFARVMINRTNPQPCDMEVDLYRLQPESQRNPISSNEECQRPYLVHSIQHSNMILLVINNVCKFEERPMSVIPNEVFYNESLSCYRIKYNKLNRIRPKSCINKHEKEEEIDLCGHGTITSQNFFLWSLCLSTSVFLGRL